MTQTWEGIWEQGFEIFVSITCIEHKHLLFNRSRAQESCYRPQRSCEGYVFTCVCHSVHRAGDLPQCMLGYHPHPGSRPPRPGTTPREQTPRPGTPRTVADGTHPTGMHSWFQNAKEEQ